MADNPNSVLLAASPSHGFTNSPWLIASGLIPPLGLVVALYLWLAKKARRLALLTLVVSLLVALLGIYLIGTAGNSLTYHYQRLATISVPGNQDGVGMNFSKPVEFNEATFSAVGAKSFVHSKAQNGKQTAIGQLSTASSPYLLPNASLFLKSLTDPLNQGSSNSHYSQVVAPITNYAKGLFPGYSVSLSPAATFHSANLTQNSWQFGLEATKAGSTTSNWSGKLIYSLGHNGVYYFSVSTIDPNWNSNAQIWQQVVNSLKVDQ